LAYAEHIEALRRYGRQFWNASRTGLGESATFIYLAIGLIVALPVLFWWATPSGFWNEGSNAFLISLGIFLGPSTMALRSAVHCIKYYGSEMRYAKQIVTKVNRDLGVLDGDREAISPDDLTPNRYILAEMVDSRCHELVEKHYQTAKALRSDDGIAEQIIDRQLHPLRLGARPWSGIALRLGILMTFVGLLIGLQPIADSLRDSTRQSIPLGELMAGLTISFATSIAGLSAALVIHLMVYASDRSFERLVALLDDLSLRLRILFSNARFGGNLTRTVDHLSEQIRKHAAELESHGVQVNKSVNSIIARMKGNATHTEQMIAAVARSQDQLASLETRHREHVQRLSEAADEIRSYEDRWLRHFESILEKSGETSRIQAETLAASVSKDLSGIQERFSASQTSDRNALGAAFVPLSEAAETARKAVEQFLSSDRGGGKELASAIRSLEQKLSQLDLQRMPTKASFGARFLSWLVITSTVGAGFYFGYPAYRPLVAQLLVQLDIDPDILP
jgi:hypothetical protein